jgi:hypothetical protein
LNIAKEELEELKIKDEYNLYETFLLALIENRVDSVNIFLENRLDISEFMNEQRLCQLYFNEV